MPKIPIFRLGGRPEKPALPQLTASTPSMFLEGISVGVDNLRHDVVLPQVYGTGTRSHHAAAHPAWGTRWRDQAGHTGGAGTFMDAQPGAGHATEAGCRGVEGGIDRITGRLPESGEKRVQAID